jgi:uncharacterized protein YkwD
MTKCEQCQKKVMFPFECTYCGKSFCAEHRLPENHNCSNLPRDSEFWYRKKKAMDGVTEKETEPELSFVKTKSTESKKKEQKVRARREAPRKILRSTKTVGAIIIGVIILGVFILSWSNFFAQLIMPNFVNTSQVETDVFKLINIERANRGLPTLSKDEALTTIALEWSKHLAEIGNLTHGDFESRIVKIGYSEYPCGEIIAMYGGWAPNLGREFVDMWLHSPEHYAIMMTASIGYMGVGVSKGSQGFFAVVDFCFS